MKRHSILGWSGAFTASIFMLAACGSSATSGSGSAASGGGQASAQTTSSGASATTSAAASHAPLAAAIDPCTLITQDEAKAAMGADPGAGKPAAGTPACTYGSPGSQTGGGYMLVADADVSHVPGFDNFNKDTARTKIQETIAKNGGTLTETSGIGDWGFMVLGASGKAAASYIFFVKGSIYVSIVLIPSSTTPATGDVMTGLAKLAADRV
jgi:hypothetical protein